MVREYIQYSLIRIYGRGASRVWRVVTMVSIPQLCRLPFEALHQVVHLELLDLDTNYFILCPVLHCVEWNTC